MNLTEAAQNGPMIISLPTPPHEDKRLSIIVETQEIDPPTLRQSLSLLATRLSSNRQDLTIIVVGGVRSLLYLGARPSSHDEDPFGRWAEEHSEKALVGEWFNPENVMWIEADLHAKLSEQAVRDDVVVFEQAGLKLLAAPFNFAWSAKMSRLMDERNLSRECDMSDAVAYLYAYNQTQEGHPVRARTLGKWRKAFQVDYTKAALKEVDMAYRREYGTNGLCN